MDYDRFEIGDSALLLTPISLVRDGTYDASFEQDGIEYGINLNLEGGVVQIWEPRDERGTARSYEMGNVTGLDRLVEQRRRVLAMEVPEFNQFLSRYEKRSRSPSRT